MRRQKIMRNKEQWIWLPKDKYKNEQENILSGFEFNKEQNFIVAEFEKKYEFSKKIDKARLRFSGDTVFQLFCNGDIVATGPACVGGDFIGNETVRDNFYAFETEINPRSNKLNFFARVRMTPVQLCEYSKGHGGLMVSGILTFEDGTKQWIGTDESWLVRRNGSYAKDCFYDGRISPDEYVNSEVIEDLWNVEVAPIPVRVENELRTENSLIYIRAGEEKDLVLDFDKIWAGFVKVKSEIVENPVQNKNNEADCSCKNGNKKEASEGISVDISCREIEETASGENIILKDNDDYRGFYMHSMGNMAVKIKNGSKKDAKVQITFVETHYPVDEEAVTITSDEDINRVLETCKHTLKICRQTHHLDSPRHCEPMACTGDYYIESLMTMFSFGDMRLAEFDLVRTALMLERENGRMFHTTYSMIWIRMLYDTYMVTGNIELLKRCKKALRLLLERIKTYVGENGLIETPPNYLFVDWIYIDGLSMHHPPKALGQTCMNMFYFGALTYGEKIFKELSCDNEAIDCARDKEKLGQAINTLLYDKEKRMYFEGLNTPDGGESDSCWLPENVEKRYYMKHSNILAAYVGVCDDELAKDLIDRIVNDDIEGDCQPYFIHYLLEAVFRLGLREKYTLNIIKRWVVPVRECSKGLVEGFVKPEPTYSFDHSHAWGGTPLYSLPKALLGLEIMKPGMREIKINPDLLGFKYATVELMTPYGKVKCKMNTDNMTVSAPKEVAVIGYK